MIWLKQILSKVKVLFPQKEQKTIYSRRVKDGTKQRH
jgi:hypothetical protein